MSNMGSDVYLDGDAERNACLDLTGTLTDLGQTALAALEAGELLADPAARRGMADDARGLVLEMIQAARRFAGLPDTGG